MEHSGGETVEKVEKSGHENHNGRFDGHSRCDKQDGKAARNQVAAGDGVGDMLLEAHFVCFYALQR